MKYTDIVYLYFTPALGGVIMFINAFELAVFYTTTKTHQINMALVYIINLCISDILVGAFMVILKSMDPFLKTTLKDSEIAAQVYNVVRFCMIRLSLFVSVTNLMALTADRMFVVSKPFEHRKHGKKFAVKMCACVWAVSVSLAVGIYCIVKFQAKDTKRYSNLVFPVVVIPAICVFVFCYVKIFKIIQGSGEKMRRFSSDQERKDALTQKAKEVVFIKMALKTVLIFCLCWLPYAVCSIVLATGLRCWYYEFQMTLFTLAFANSFINPFIYLVHVRKATKKLLANLLCCLDYRRQNRDKSVSSGTASTSAGSRKNKNASTGSDDVFAEKNDVNIEDDDDMTEKKRSLR